MTHAAIAVAAVIAACAAPERPRVVLVSPAVVVPPVIVAAPPCCDDGDPPAQPPEVELVLGHYASARFAIGAVIDRTHAEALLRFDGSDDIEHLVATAGQFGRTDWEVSGGHVVMQTWDDGRVVLYVSGHEIAVRRDGDADPL